MSEPLSRNLRAAAALVAAGALCLIGYVALAKEAAPPMGPMSREAAVKMIKSFQLAYKLADSPGLNEKNLGGVDVEGQPVYFEYQPDKKVLRTSALVYRFRQAPKPGVIEGFKKEEQAGTDTGGGSVDYQPESKSLFLTRSYPQAVDGGQYTKETQRLMGAARKWGQEVLERVSTKVFHPGDAKSP